MNWQQGKFIPKSAYRNWLVFKNINEWSLALLISAALSTTAGINTPMNKLLSPKADKP